MLFPVECGAHDECQIVVLRLPVQFLLGDGGIGDDQDRIAGPAAGDPDREIDAGTSLTRFSTSSTEKPRP